MKQGFLTIKFKGNEQYALIEALTAVFREMGIDLYCFVRDEEAWGEKTYSVTEVMERAFARIRKTDIMVVEFTEKGVGVGIEIGYAAALGKPVIVIAPPEADISNTLRGVMRGLYRYNDPADLLAHKDEILGMFS